MDMKDNEKEDMLLRDFFLEASHTEIADEGFSQHVMSRIDPISQRRMRIASRVWTAACCIAAIVLMPWTEMASQAKSGIMAFICRFPLMAGNIIEYICHDQTAISCIVSAPWAATAAVAAWCMARYRKSPL